MKKHLIAAMTAVGILVGCHSAPATADPHDAPAPVATLMDYSHASDALAIAAPFPLQVDAAPAPETPAAAAPEVALPPPQVSPGAAGEAKPLPPAEPETDAQALSMAFKIWKLAHEKDTLPAVALGMLMLAWAFRRFAEKRIHWFATKWGGRAVGFGLPLIVEVAGALYMYGLDTGHLATAAWTAFVTGLTAAGLWGNRPVKVAQKVSSTLPTKSPLLPVARVVSS